MTTDPPKKEEQATLGEKLQDDSATLNNMVLRFCDFEDQLIDLQKRVQQLEDSGTVTRNSNSPQPKNPLKNLVKTNDKIKQDAADKVKQDEDKARADKVKVANDAKKKIEDEMADM